MNLQVGCLLALILLILPPAIAARFLPWWGVLILVVVEAVALAIAGPKVVGWALKRFAMSLFMTKSQVLRGAAVELHDVRATRRPGPAELIEPTGEPLSEQALAEPPDEDDAEEAEDEADRRYVQVEFTLRPKPPTGRMQFFDPDELLLVPYDARVTFDADDGLDGQSAESVQTFLHDAATNSWQSPDGKLPGTEPHRLRVIFRCPSALRGRAKFRYYFEAFGDVPLPD